MQKLYPILFLVFFIILGLVFGYKGYDAFQQVENVRLLRANEIEKNELKSAIRIRKVYSGESSFDENNRSTWSTDDIRKSSKLAMQSALTMDNNAKEQQVRMESLVYGISQLQQHSRLYDNYRKTGETGLEAARTEKNKVKDRLETMLLEMTQTHDREKVNFERRKLEIKTRIDEEDARYREYQAEYQSRVNTQLSQVQIYRDQMEVLIKRPRVRATLDTDGQVIFSDPINRKVGINVGSEHGVRPGMRFEVYNVDKDKSHNRIRKGFIVVQKVNPLHSICLTKLDELYLGTDPFGYTASEPEERYSPTSAVGGDTLRPLPLSGEPAIALRGPTVENPILEGDLIQCPFFERYRKLNFLVLGDKELAYPIEHIMQVLREYDCTVSMKVDPEVDMVLVRTWSIMSEDKQLAEAIKLGLKIVYEVEILPFLRK